MVFVDLFFVFFLHIIDFLGDYGQLLVLDCQRLKSLFQRLSKMVVSFLVSFALDLMLKLVRLFVDFGSCVNNLGL